MNEHDAWVRQECRLLQGDASYLYKGSRRRRYEVDADYKLWLGNSLNQVDTVLIQKHAARISQQERRLRGLEY